jgi:hypothetical protein
MNKIETGVAKKSLKAEDTTKQLMLMSIKIFFFKKKITGFSSLVLDS